MLMLRYGAVDAACWSGMDAVDAAYGVVDAALRSG